MTSLSRRNRRTTARRTTPLTLAASTAAVLTLCVLPGLAQPPGYLQGGNPQAAGKLLAPPGDRPPAQQAQPKHPTRVPGSAGIAMYFQKPADALTVAGEADTSSAGAMAQLKDAPRAPLGGTPDALTPPPPPDSRYLGSGARRSSPPITLPAATAAPTGLESMSLQPKGSELPPSKSKKLAIPAVPDSEVRLPPRTSIFGIVYNDAQLEKAIMERLRNDLKREGKYNEKQEPYLVFPPLPVISPPGVAYQPKTVNYPPRQAILEPGYVVHRRLHFEERNAERYGWDLGPMQTLVSAAYFFGDVLAWPHSLASGCVYGFWETSAGKCAPGSPVPYLIYPPQVTASGSAFETLVILTTAFAFLP